MNIFKRAAKKVTGVAKKTVNVVKAGGRAIDPTYSKGALGQFTYKVARPAVATVAAAYTAGGSVILAEKTGWKKSTLGKQSTVTGYAIGATVGASALASPVLKKLANDAVGTAAAAATDGPNPGIDVPLQTTTQGNSVQTASLLDFKNPIFLGIMVFFGLIVVLAFGRKH